MTQSSAVLEEIVFEEPPAAAHTAYTPVWGPRLMPLRDRPGEWARVHVSSKGHAYSVGGTIKRGGYSGVTKGEFEVSIKRVPDSESDEWGVWARFVG